MLLPAFLELESAIKIHRHNHDCDYPEPDEEFWEVISDNLSKAGSAQDASQLGIQTPEQSSSPTRMVATGNLETINSSQQEQLSNN